MTIRSVTFTRSAGQSSGPRTNLGEGSTLPPIKPLGLKTWDDGEDVSSDADGLTLDLSTPEVFEPLLDHYRFKGARGGRGGAKSHFFCEQIVENMVSRHTRQACLREVQTSIRDSVKQLIEDKIARLGVQDLFTITDREIVCPSTDSLCIFKGLRNHTVSSIKSLEGFTDAFVEEAHTISQRSMDTMIPTFRSNSQISFAWNPESPTDPVDKLFEDNFYIAGDEDFICVEANYWDNPWFPEELRRDMERDRRRDPEKYDHVWCGGYVKNAESRVFKNWKCESFITPTTNVQFLHGADWGFSVDPTVLVRGFLGEFINGNAVPNPKGKTLFIDHEAYKVGVEIDHTPALFDGLVKDRGVPVISQMKSARGWTIIADSANPQAISYLNRNGYNVKPAKKGPNSIKEGIAFLQGYDIVVHPRCVHTHDELIHYSYEIDPHTKLVLPILSEKKNHVIDSLRYAVEPLRRSKSYTIFGSY
jgi:phage terminase large subunit